VRRKGEGRGGKRKGRGEIRQQYVSNVSAMRQQCVSNTHNNERDMLVGGRRR